MITIIDYGMGNLGSINNMLKKIGYPAEISTNPEQIALASKIILPGVGSFDRAMSNLEKMGIISLIRNKAYQGIPMLGICLGMQLLANGSEEGVLSGLGLIPGEVKKFSLPASYKVPHMGWNVVRYNKDSPLYKDFEQFEESRFYFVHSFHFVPEKIEHITGQTPYGEDFTSSISEGNVYGVQFHPEKSHKFGMRLLSNFIKYC